MEPIYDTERHPIKPTLFYAPPYERPAEDEFAWHLVKYLRPLSRLEYQEPYVTYDGNTRWVDFLLVPATENGRRKAPIAFEITGEESPYVDADIFRICTSVYVLHRDDVIHRLHDIFALLVEEEPELFTERGTQNIGVISERKEKRNVRVLRHRAMADVEVLR